MQSILTSRMVSAHRNSDKVAFQKFDAYKLFWMFFIGSGVGFVFETIWCFIKHGRIECRSSFLLIPLTAVYGIGALVLYIGLNNVDRHKILHIFAFGVIAGTTVEYLASWLQEVLFGTVSWDYSKQFLSIGGRVCLISAIVWGILAVLWVIVIQPLFEKLIKKIPSRIYKPLTYVLAILIAVNAVISVAAVSRWCMRIDGVPATRTVTVMLDRLFPNEMMGRIFPNMIFGK